METGNEQPQHSRNMLIFFAGGVSFVALLAVALGCGLAASFFIFARSEGSSNQAVVAVNEASDLESIEQPVEKSKSDFLTKGAPAPDFSLNDLDGNSVTLSNYEGRPVIINFWATWCGPCEDEMPDIQEVYDTYRGEGLVVLAINLEEHPDTARSFVEYYTLTFPILSDRNAVVGTQYQVRGLPTTYIIDESGDIVHIQIGQITSYNLHRWMERMGLK